MKIELPLETWTDLFAFVSRSQLAELGSQIADRHFTSFLNFFLHKCGEIKLGKLHIKLSTNGGNGAIVSKNGREFPLADFPMPKNIKNFEAIRLSYFDESVLYFLQQFQLNSLLTYINLIFYIIKPHSALINILPLINTINSIYVHRPKIMPLLQAEYSGTSETVWASARILQTCYEYCDDHLLCDWLFNPKEDGKPRVLKLYSDCFADDFDQDLIFPFVENVKKYFLESNQASSFIIEFNGYIYSDTDFHQTLDNIQTNEKLVIEAIGSYVHISRYPMEANEEWIKEMQNTWFEREERELEICL